MLMIKSPRLPTFDIIDEKTPSVSVVLKQFDLHYHCIFSIHYKFKIVFSTLLLYVLDVFLVPELQHNERTESNKQRMATK